jgi:glycosyltransferase involved in cell wall biosynthesis
MYNRPAPAWRENSALPARASRMSDSSPLVSIIVPTRDRRALLAETIDSVRRQTYDNWELIVVDDGSIDGTAQMLGEISREDSRIRHSSLASSRTGAPAGRNDGLQISRGSLIVFLDSDDLLAPSCLARRVGVMQTNSDLDFAVFTCQVFRDRIDDTRLLFNADTGEDDLDRLLKIDVPWQTASPIWRRAALGKIGPWDEEAQSAQDWEFHIRALAAALRYGRFGPMDCYWRSASEQRESIGKSSYLQPAYQQSRVILIRKMWQLLKDRDLLNDPRREMFAAMYFRTACAISSRRQARQIWAQARADGVLCRWEMLADIAMRSLRRSWPSGYFVPKSATLLRAPWPSKECAESSDRPAAVTS